MRALLRVACLPMLVLPLYAHGRPASPHPARLETASLVRLEVDGREYGDTVALVDGGEVWVGTATLQAAGFAIPSTRATARFGATWLALSDISPRVTWTLDGSTVRISTRPAVASAQPRRAGVVRLLVDGSTRGDVMVRSKNDDVWAGAASLLAAGIPGGATAERETVNGAEWIRLGSLSSRIRFELAPDALRIQLAPAREALLVRLERGDATAPETVLVRRGGELWLPVASLTAMGVAGFSGNRDTIDGVPCVALDSLAPGISGELDRRALVLRLRVRPEFLLDPSSSGAGSDLVALLDLVINGVRHGAAETIVHGKEVRVDAQALRAAGFQKVPASAVGPRGKQWVPLTSLAPDVSWELDDRALALRLTAAPELLGLTRIDLTPRRPKDIDYSSEPAAFLNYAARWNGEDDPDLAGELGLSAGRALFTGTVTRDPLGYVRRGPASLTWDEPKHLLRVEAGDQYARTGALGGGALIAGLGITHERALDPYHIATPTLDHLGAIATTSTVEVYVNDRLVRRETLEPGSFQLDNLPLQTGRGSTRVVVRDAFGREKEIVRPYYLTAGSLAPGEQDFGYHAGVVRLPPPPGRPTPGLGRAGFGAAPARPVTADLGTYGEPVALARHRVGVTRWLTAGARAEGSRDLQSGGLTLSLALPIGQVETSGAVSRRTGDLEPGRAVSAAWAFSTRRFHAGASVSAQDPVYLALGQDPAYERALRDARGFAGLQLGSFASLSGEHAVSELSSGLDRTRSSLYATVRLTSRASLLVTAARTVSGEVTDDAVFAGVSVNLGRGNTALASRSMQGGVESSGLQVHKSLPVGNGVGYRVQAHSIEPAAPGGEPLSTGSATVQYQSRSARWEMTAEGANDRPSRFAGGAAGAFVFVDRTLVTARPVEQSFALVRVPGVSGVRVYASNQEVGRTNRNGILLVPNLLPYYGNRIGIEYLDVPMSHHVGATERVVAPPVRGAAAVEFPVRIRRTVVGSLDFMEGGTRVIPSYGEIRVTTKDGTAVSPIGKDGEFYFESLPAGKHVATVEFAGRTLRLPLKVPAGTTLSADLGHLRFKVPPPVATGARRRR